MADDLLRFMYQHKISTATLGGHGIGGLLALKAATRHFDRFTGFFGLDFTPMDYNKFDVFQDAKKGLGVLSRIEMHKPKAAILSDIGKSTENEKLRNLFRQSIVKHGNADYTWNFNLKAVEKDLQNQINFASWGVDQGSF